MKFSLIIPKNIDLSQPTFQFDTEGNQVITFEGFEKDMAPENPCETEAPADTEPKAARRTRGKSHLPPITELRAKAIALGIDPAPFGTKRHALIDAIATAMGNMPKADAPVPVMEILPAAEEPEIQDILDAVEEETPAEDADGPMDVGADEDPATPQDILDLVE